MEIIGNLEQYSQKKPLALSIGMFDGVHLGHQEIIKKLKHIAESQGLYSAILTFTPHPRLVFNSQDDLKLLNTDEEKRELLENLNIETLIIQEFNEEFRSLSGEEFIREILVKKLNVKHLIIGYDHTFGKNKSGNFQLLEKLSEELGYQVEQLEAFGWDYHTISSTQIRNALLEGNILQANAMLGYHYSISGKVIDGKKIGRTIGYPTANLEIDEHKLIPKKGAYIVEVFVEGEKYKGMLSIGTNPTVGGKNLSVEVYILDFDKQIYGENIKVSFREFLHDEIAFQSMSELIERLDKDKIITENFKF